MSTIQVDCFGHDVHESTLVEAGDQRWHFCFDRDVVRSSPGPYGMFVDYWASMNRRYLAYPRSARVAMLGEPRASRAFLARPELGERFGLVLTHDARLLARGEPYVEFPFGTTFLEELVAAGQSVEKTHDVSMIGGLHPDAESGGHALRSRVFELALRRGDIDCFGRGVRWVESKLTALGPYRFSITMENHAQDFYFSEKVIDCFVTDTVPIYYGCPGIDRYFDPSGMLQFSTLDELEALLDGLDAARYEEMLPALRENRRRAEALGYVTRKQLYERAGAAIARHLEPRRGASLRTRAAMRAFAVRERLRPRRTESASS